MRHITRALALALSILSLGSCDRPGNFLYIYPASQHVEDSVQVKQMIGSNQLDILWIIDNSGSMAQHQQDVLNNMNTFITTLTSSANQLDWKSGLISTSIEDDPYGGFKPGTELLSSDPNVGPKFEADIGQLGTDGDGQEMTFDPTVKVLTNYPNWRRPGAAFAMILISDAAEQSNNYTVTTFLQFLSNLNGGLNQTFFYGFLNPDDWCTATDDDWWWTGSPFQTLSNTLQGAVYKLCDPNFAGNLKDLGANLAKQVTASRIYLKQIPKPDTIKVFYLGQPVPGGTPAQGGYWTYRQDLNAVEFSSLSFAPSQNASVQVQYDVDNGVH